MTVGEQDFLRRSPPWPAIFLGGLDEMSKLPPVKIPSVSDEGPRRPSLVQAAGGRLREAMGLEPDEPLDDLMYEAERLGAR